MEGSVVLLALFRLSAWSMAFASRVAKRAFENGPDAVSNHTLAADVRRLKAWLIWQLTQEDKTE